MYAITMSVDVAAEIGGAATSQVLSAFVDPVFTIDPGFSGATDYSLLFSDGIGNSPDTTPLPASLPLFATGLGALGMLGWRRKRKAQAAA